LAVEFILDGEPRKENGCPLCGNERGVIEDFTLSCPSCTRGLRYSAELLLVERGVDPEIVFAVLSRLESEWLLSQIPKEAEVSA
jgi:ribosomal protein S14